MKAFQVVCLGLASAVMALPEPTITAPAQLPVELRMDAELEARAASESHGPAFVGYIDRKNDGKFEESSCGTGYWTESDNVGGCVTKNGAAIPIGCINSSAMRFANGATGACTGNMTCNYWNIYDNMDKQSTLSYYLCFTTGQNPKGMYRATTTAESSTTMASSSPSTAQASVTGTATSTMSTVPTDGTSGGGGNGGGEGEGGGKSMAWIAGPIVGGIAGIVIIGLLVWVVLLLRKRKRANAEGTSPDMAQHDTAGGAGAGAGAGGYGQYPPPASSTYGSPRSEHLKYAPPGSTSTEHAQPYIPPQPYPPQWAYAHNNHAPSELDSSVPTELPANTAAVEMGDSRRA